MVRSYLGNSAGCSALALTGPAPSFGNTLRFLCPITKLTSTICVCKCVRVRAYVCTGIHMNMSVHVALEVRGHPLVPLTFCLTQGLLTDLKLHQQTRLGGQPALGPCPSLPASSLTTAGVIGTGHQATRPPGLAFHIGLGDLKSGPHVSTSLLFFFRTCCLGVLRVTHRASHVLGQRSTTLPAPALPNPHFLRSMPTPTVISGARISSHSLPEESRPTIASREV